MPAIIAIALYLPLVQVGFLADDYLFLGWAKDGLSTLLARVTFDSNPQMIRPWPALIWAAAASAWAATGLHVVSLVLHALASVLVAFLAGRLSRDARIGSLVGCLFASFPLIAEPVVWLSASFDLWATVGCLATLAILQSEWHHATLAATACFVLALASKESAVILPVVALLLVPHRRQSVAVLTTIAAIYLGLRLALFSGLGGYAVRGERGFFPALDLVQFLRNALFQIPFRVAWGVKSSSDLGPWIFAASAFLTLAAAILLPVWKRWGSVSRVFGTYFLALLPVASILSLDVDHESSRLIYLPAALTLTATGLLFRKSARAIEIPLALLCTVWIPVAWSNSQAWVQAGRVVNSTLTLLATESHSLPAGSTVLVAAPELQDGAYVWRNGLVAATRLLGMRSDLNWVLGTAALFPIPAQSSSNRNEVGPNEPLGRNVFELGRDPSGSWGENTTCQVALRKGRDGARFLGELDLSLAAEAAPEAHGELRAVPFLELLRPTQELALELSTGDCRADLQVSGWASWRTDTNHRFSRSRALEFRLLANSRTILSLPRFGESIQRLQLRFDLGTQEAAVCLRRLEAIFLPSECLES